MKIFVYGIPRSGTTVLQSGIAATFGLKNFGENDGLLLPPDNYVIKKISNQSASTVDYLSRLKDTTTIIVRRKDLINCCLSLHFVLHTQKFHYCKDDSSEFKTLITVPLDHVMYWKEHILAPYLQFTREHQDAIIVNYTDIVNNSVYILGQRVDLDKAPTRPSNINYAALCTNYKEIEELFND